MSDKEPVSPLLTYAQKVHLRRAAARPDGRISWGARSNGGGALIRMCWRLKQMGLLEGPPYIITDAGRRAVSSHERGVK